MSKAERILEIFKTNGGMMSTRSLAVAAIETGVWAEHELNNATVAWAQGQCRNALKVIDGYTKLPFAVPSAAEVWYQLDLASYGVLEFNINERTLGILKDYQVLKRLHAFTVGKFGKAPEIPEFVSK